MGNPPEVSVPLDAPTTPGLLPGPSTHRRRAVIGTAVWTGSEMIIWEAGYLFGVFNTGARYDPATDSWIATNIRNAPISRGSESGVWTGSEMIIWGGLNSPAGNLNNGGRYTPSRIVGPLLLALLAPLTSLRLDTATRPWTSSEMIVCSRRWPQRRFYFPPCRAAHSPTRRMRSTNCAITPAPGILFHCNLRVGGPLRRPRPRRRLPQSRRHRERASTISDLRHRCGPD